MFESHRAHPRYSGTFFFICSVFKDLMSVPNKGYISGEILFPTRFLRERLPFGIFSQEKLATFNKNLNSLYGRIFFKRKFLGLWFFGKNIRNHFFKCFYKCFFSFQVIVHRAIKHV